MYASYLQQKAPNINVGHLIEQVNILRNQKRLGTVIYYPRPRDNAEYELTVMAFEDASKPSEHDQIGVFLGLLIEQPKRVQSITLLRGFLINLNAQ